MINKPTQQVKNKCSLSSKCVKVKILAGRCPLLYFLVKIHVAKLTKNDTFIARQLKHDADECFTDRINDFKN